MTASAPSAVPLLGIVVVNYGSSALLRANLAERGIGGPHDRVVVVDNSADPAERATVAALCADSGWQLVALPHNPGFGAAVNAGVAAARAAGCVTFLCLNPDAVVTPAVVDALREHSLREPLALISPRIEDSSGAVVFQGVRMDLRDGRMHRRPDDASGPAPEGFQEWLTGACLVVHHELFDRMGGFAEDYFLYWEDVDLSRRALDVGGTLVLRPDLVVVHDEGGTQVRGSARAKSATYYRYNCRNRLLFAARHLPRRDLLRWLVRTPAESRQILLRGGRRQLLTSSAPLRAALRGTAEGVGLALRALVRPPAGTQRGPAPALVVHPGAELYGSDRMLLEAVSALVDAGRPVTVALPGPGPLTPLLRDRGADVVVCPMPVLRKAALRPAGAVRLLRDGLTGLLPAVALVRRHGSVYVNTLTIPSWLVLARLLRRPVLCHVHEAERSAPRLLRRAMALAPRLADGVVVNSRFSLGVLADVAPSLRERAVVVYNGVQGPADVTPARRAPDGALRLLFIGRLSPRKGPQVAVATLRELLARGIDAHLTLLGSVFEGYEWFEEELHEAVREAGLEARVDFLGFRPEVWPVLAGADVVLVPSLVDEPFGNTAVEAVLAARPVVVSGTSGLVEAVTGYGSAQCVEPGRTDAWADAVARIAADWPRYRDAAAEDAATAALRHAPREYQRHLAEAFTALGTAGARRRGSAAR